MWDILIPWSLLELSLNAKFSRCSVVIMCFASSSWFYNFFVALSSVWEVLSTVLVVSFKGLVVFLCKCNKCDKFNLFYYYLLFIVVCQRVKKNEGEF